MALAAAWRPNTAAPGGLSAYRLTTAWAAGESCSTCLRVCVWGGGEGKG